MIACLGTERPVPRVLRSLAEGSLRHLCPPAPKPIYRFLCKQMMSLSESYCDMRFILTAFFLASVAAGAQAEAGVEAAGGDQWGGTPDSRSVHWQELACSHALLTCTPWRCPCSEAVRQAQPRQALPRPPRVLQSICECNRQHCTSELC